MSVGFVHKEFVTMHGHTILKLVRLHQPCSDEVMLSVPRGQSPRSFSYMGSSHDITLHDMRYGLLVIFVMCRVNK